MIFMVCFLAGIGVGAMLAYHFGRMAELKRKAALYDRERGGS